jgi:hypothetical protein
LPGLTTLTLPTDTPEIRTSAWESVAASRNATLKR